MNDPATNGGEFKSFLKNGRSHKMKGYIYHNQREKTSAFMERMSIISIKEAAPKNPPTIAAQNFFNIMKLH